MEPARAVVEVEGLHKRYGETVALDGLDLVVDEGTVAGLIGPNGAGKTTAVRILTTLLQADAGRAIVGGFDVARDGGEVRARIGLVGQATSVDELLSGRQNLVLFGRLHHLSRPAARARADELLARFGLDDTGARAITTYSGGMRRRLDLAASLIRAPRVLFLDEPTTGLDPAGRNEVWQAVRGLVAEGTTVLLTTQYLEEVDQLADAVHLVDHGRVVAEGSPDQLKSRVGGERIDVVVETPDDVATAAVAVARAAGAEVDVSPDDRRISAPVTDRMSVLTAVVTALSDAGVSAEDISLRRPTLDEVFLRLTDRATTTTAPLTPDHQEVPA